MLEAIAMSGLSSRERKIMSCDVYSEDLYRDYDVVYTDHFNDFTFYDKDTFDDYRGEIIRIVGDFIFAVVYYGEDNDYAVNVAFKRKGSSATGIKVKVRKIESAWNKEGTIETVTKYYSTKEDTYLGYGFLYADLDGWKPFNVCFDGDKKHLDYEIDLDSIRSF